jgi:hypothetical protein
MSGKHKTVPAPNPASAGRSVRPLQAGWGDLLRFSAHFFAPVRSKNAGCPKPRPRAWPDADMGGMTDDLRRHSRYRFAAITTEAQNVQVSQETRLLSFCYPLKS